MAVQPTDLELFAVEIKPSVLNCTSRTPNRISRTSVPPFNETRSVYRLGCSISHSFSPGTRHLKLNTFALNSQDCSATTFVPSSTAKSRVPLIRSEKVISTSSNFSPAGCPWYAQTRLRYAQMEHIPGRPHDRFRQSRDNPPHCRTVGFPHAPSNPHGRPTHCLSA